MTGAEWVAVILIGGLLIPGGVFLIAGGLVYMQSDPKQGREYLEAHRARKAAEGVWQDVEVELRRAAPGAVELHFADNEYEYVVEMPAIASTPHHDTRWSKIGGAR